MAGALLATLVASAVDVADENRLPPPAPQQIDFVRDIQPILQSHCLKCHSDEKPRSGFRLTSRATALKGGEHGVDILPGNSAGSPLIRYVAHLDPEIEMPPEGRGTPLTTDEIALVRAWIEQGVAWSTNAPEPSTQLAVDPTVGWTTVHGDEKKFRELYWQREGWNGGLEEFHMEERPAPDTKVTASGHVLLDDYSLSLAAEKDGLGFGRFNWSQFRKYYDDTGGYDSLFTPSYFDLNRDLHMDVGRFGAEVGLTLPHWPSIVLGYEYQYRDGSEATLEWGPVTSGTNTANIFPAYKDISERVNILKLDVDYEFAGGRLTDNLRGEWYELSTLNVNDAAYNLSNPGMALTTASQQQTYFQGANTVHLEKQFTDWLFASGGYLYSRLDGDAATDVSTQNPLALDPTGSGALGWHAQEVELERESDIFSVSALVGPWQGLTLSLGTQNEWTRQAGFGTAGVDITLPFDPFVFPLGTETVASDLDDTIFRQTAGVRFTKLPFTTLFAEARLEQEKVSEFEEEIGGAIPFTTGTDNTSRLKDFRGGFNTSPWRRVSLTGEYHYYDRETDYNHLLKESVGLPFEGYPAFIVWRDLASQEANLKLALQLATWLKTTLTYQWLENRYQTGTEPVATDPANGLPANIAPGGGLLAGTYKAQTASINTTLTPWRRLFLSASLAYQNARTLTAASGNPAVAPYAGDIYTVSASGNYALNDKTSLVASYAFSTADFAQDNVITGLPLGISYHQHAFQVGVKRQVGKGKSLGLQYRLYDYHEPSSGLANDFRAQAIFATLALRLR